MKKIFNLAVILATLMAAPVAFTSCEDDEEESKSKVDENPQPYINVVEKGEYSASNKTLNKALTFKVKSTSGTAAAGNQVVTFTIDGQDGDIVLSDAGSSYLVATESGYVAMNNGTLKSENAYANVIMVLAKDSKKTSTDYEINSATINNTCKDKGASETLFSKNNRAANK